MYTTISQLVEMGVNPQEIEAKINGGAWKTARPDPIEEGERRILISSLPLDLQTKWARANRISSPPPEIFGLLTEAENFGLADREAKITELLSGVALPFGEFFTISLTKMSAKRFTSQKPMFTGPFGGQKSPVYWQTTR